MRAYTTILFMLVLGSAPLHGQITLPSIETKNLRIIYTDPAQYYLVPHLASCYENTFAFYHKLFGFTPIERTTVLFHDFSDWGYAGANNIPMNSIIVAIEPFDYNFDVMPANERMNWLMNHESTHLVTCDQVNARDRYFRGIFQGKVVPTPVQPMSMLYSYLTAPRRYSPRWYHEGFAVFMETWTSGGMGRTLGGYDEMVFRAMVRDSAYFYNAVGLESEGTTVDFQVGMNSYLYGTRFVAWLGAKYGPAKLISWFVRNNASDTYFSTQFETVYHVPLQDEWANWIAAENAWQQDNLRKIRAFPVTPHKQLCDRPLGSVSRAFFDPRERKLYCGLNHPGVTARIASIDVRTGAIEKISDIASPALMYVTSLARDDSSGTLFYTLHNSQNWRTIVSVDPATGEERTLLENARIGELAFNQADKSLWGTQHMNGRSVLVRIPPPYDHWETVYIFPYSHGLIDVDVSRDGRYLAGTEVDPTGKQTLVRVNVDTLLRGAYRPRPLHVFENNSASNFVHSRDGRHLYGTSYFTGVSNVWRYDLDAGTMNCVTNTETGLFRPIPVGGDSIIAFTYSGKGFMPVLIRDTTLNDVNAISYLGQQVVEKWPVVESWKLGSPAEIKIDSLTTFSGNYSILGSQHVSSVIPIVEGYKDFPSYGLRLSLHDPLMLGMMNLSASYSPNSLLPGGQRLHAAMDVRFWEWTMEASYNKADFYDLFGPTKVSRAGWSLALAYNRILRDESPEKMDYRLRAAMYGDLDRLPDYQNIDASFDRLVVLGGDLNRSFLRKSLGGVDDELGWKWQASARGNYVNGTMYPRLYGTFDAGTLTPWEHSSVWLRTAAGKSFGDRGSPFANFYFGGFGNNWVDYGDAQRYRAFYSFPGCAINSVGGSDFAKALVEWNLPAWKFREVGIVSFFVNWARLSFFGAGLVTDIGVPDARLWHYSVGTQVDFKVVMFSILESTISFGYAGAFESAGQLGNEFMASLKIMK